MPVTAIADEDVREIVSTGTLYLYRVTDPSLGLQQLILSIIDERRLAMQQAEQC